VSIGKSIFYVNFAVDSKTKKIVQKFIVTSQGRFKFGDVNMHKELLEPGEECIGGGMYEYDHVGQRLLLYGKSYDYGRVKWSYIDTLIMPGQLRGLDVEYEELPLQHFLRVTYE